MMIGVGVGVKLLNWRLGRLSQPNNLSQLSVGVRAFCSRHRPNNHRTLSLDLHVHVLSEGRLKALKSFAPISTSGWTSSCLPCYFTRHFGSEQRCRVMTRHALGIFQRNASSIWRSRSRSRDKEHLSVKYNSTCYRFTHSDKHSELHKDQDDPRQQFHYNTSVASFLSLSTLFIFAIYCLWKKAFIDSEVYRVASCLSQEKGSEVHFDDKSAEDNLTKSSDISTNFLSHIPSQTESGIHSKSSGKIHGKVEETDTLSFWQAVEKVDDLLEKRKAEVGSPGIVVCVSIDGKFVYAKGYGHADVENQVPIHPHSVIRIASISKAMTAAIVAKLVDEGKIDLDQSVYHYVPKFPEKEFHGEKVDFTVRQLLSHTSGIRSYWLENDPVIALQPKLDEIISEFDTGIQHLFYTNLKHHPKKQTVKEKKKKVQKEAGTNLSTLPPEYYQTEVFPSTTKALDMFSKDRLVAKPDTRFIYSTLAYTLLAAVVEAVNKKSFASVAKETFHLWGMKETYLDQNDPLIYNRARHYQKKKGTLVNTPYVDVSYKWAGGGFLSSVMDVVKFGNILLYSSQHGNADSGLPGYIKQSTIHEFWTPIEHKQTGREYGLGFELHPSKMAFGMCPIQSFEAGHSGAAVGASSQLLIFPRWHSQIKVDVEKKRKHESIKSSHATSHGSALSSNKDTPQSQMPSALPQGVVVAVIVNLIGVSLTEVTEEIARIFERVVLD